MSEDESTLIPKVEKYLQDEYFFSPEDYDIETSLRTFFIKGEITTGLEVLIYRVQKHKNFRLFLLGWGEQLEANKGLVFCREIGTVTERDAFRAIREEIQTNAKIQKYAKSPLFLEKVKNRNLQEELERSKQEIERLKEKKRELKYRPGGYGALKAQQHFSKYFE
uniref:Uncharacterized protein n=1 Tax=Marseillevirus sp. TaxID=2809551 RepID=A0AA96J2X9_9VIRU|nr:hypothetical protein MarFTMF_089 [Marseillevirus sp.]